jgi:glyoxylase-like metal-dependent hydrolase (beta-lactamase superfamily II)
LQLHPANGHTADGMAIWIEWAGVLVVGDYLSPLEIR